MAANETSIKITADASGVVKGVSVAQGALAKLQGQMGELSAISARGLSIIGIAGLGAAATAAAAALFGAVKAAADYGDQLDNMRQRTGIAVEDLAKLQYAAKLSDTSTEALGKGLKVLAGLMVAAAGGAANSSALFEQYHIALRNTDGSVRSTVDVLGDLADVFSTMPDGANKSALAAEFFGQKMGVELIPLLNQGKAGIQALGDEAVRLGLVMGADQAKAAADFNDRLDKMSALSNAAKVAIGAALIPVLNDFLQKLIFARENKLSLGQILFDVLPKQSSDFAAQIDQAVAKLDGLKDLKARLGSSLGGIGDSIGLGSVTGNAIKEQEKLIAYLKQQQAELTSEEAAAANKRILIGATLAGKLQQLEKLRSIAVSQVSVDILKSDKDLNAARLKDAEALRDALRAAYQTTAADAKTAADAAIALLDKARQKRNSGADKALEQSTSGLSPEEKAAVNAAQAQDLYDQGRYAAAAAGAAKLDGRLEQMAAYQKQAEEYLSRAESFADKAASPDLTQGIADAQAQLLEQQAKAKDQEAKDLQQRAADQMATLNQIEAKIKEMTTAAANFEIKGNLTQLESDIARMRAEIEKGAVMPISAVASISGGGGSVNPQGGASGSFASGGFTGWTGRKTIAGVVHGMEHVMPAHVTLQPGVLPFLEAMRKYGNKVLPGYEKGGLVTALPALSSAVPSPMSTTPLVLDFGKLGRYKATASTDTAAEITRVFKRVALGFGRD